MDWWKLFALLAVAASLFLTAEGAKKKIRIHLPQKVKHIHHHKKIYITNHPASASSQYAPAFLPSAGGGGGVPLPPLPPLLYDAPSGSSASASKLLPLYQGRGYYGPAPGRDDWEEQELDLVPPPEPAASGFLPSAFSAPSGPAAAPSSLPPKRLKVVKVKEPRKKKVLRKRKPKRPPSEAPPVEEEHPVSSFHEQFYSDLDNAGTIRKLRKPKRVEKIVDGDTEHIHTYSEEHIHKVVFDEQGKRVTGVAGVDAGGAISSLLPLRNHHALLAAEGDSYLAGAGSLGTPSHLEYAAYNPRDVTHDHVFHDHGELPANLELTKTSLGFPPRASYTSTGLKINGDYKRLQNKHKHRKPARPTPPTVDFSYYENMYSPNAPGRPKMPVRHPLKYNNDQSSESIINDFRPVPAFRFKDTAATKPSSYFGYGGGSQANSYQVGQASVPVPFSTSGNHDFSPASFSGIRAPAASSFSNFKDPFQSYRAFGNSAYDNSYAPSSNNGAWPPPTATSKGKKKSVSTQNVSFGGQDHKTTVDHLAQASQDHPSVVGSGHGPMRFEGFDDSKPVETATPTTHYTITENTPEHDYYTSMAIKAFQEDPLALPEASNDIYQYAEAPSAAEASASLPTVEAPRYFQQSSTPAPEEARRPGKRRRARARQPTRAPPAAAPLAPAPAPAPSRTQLRHYDADDGTRGTFKYGDKL